MITIVIAKRSINAGRILPTMIAIIIKRNEKQYLFVNLFPLNLFLTMIWYSSPMKASSSAYVRCPSVWLSEYEDMSNLFWPGTLRNIMRSFESSGILGQSWEDWTVTWSPTMSITPEKPPQLFTFILIAIEMGSSRLALCSVLVCVFFFWKEESVIYFSTFFV